MKGDIIVSGDKVGNCIVVAISADGHSYVNKFEVKGSKLITSIVILNGNKRIIIGTLGNDIHMYDLHTGDVISS